MDDLEMILRFFALREYWKNLPNQNISRVLDTYMQQHRNMSAQGIQRLEEEFQQCIKICDDLWRGNAFYRPISRTAYREQMIAPLYDAQMIAVSVLVSNGRSAELRRINKERIQNSRFDLYENDDQFTKSVTQATNNASNVYYRIRTLQELLISLT